MANATIFQIVGILVMLIGVAIFWFDKREATNAIKIIGMEFSFSTPSLIVFLIGAGLLAFPFTAYFQDRRGANAALPSDNQSAEVQNENDKPSTLDAASSGQPNNESEPSPNLYTQGGRSPEAIGRTASAEPRTPTTPNSARVVSPTPPAKTPLILPFARPEPDPNLSGLAGKKIRVVYCGSSDEKVLDIPEVAEAMYLIVLGSPKAIVSKPIKFPFWDKKFFQITYDTPDNRQNALALASYLADKTGREYSVPSTTDTPGNGITVMLIRRDCPSPG